MQVKLLRLLQEHEFRPVGSLKQHKVNIRVIAATHHDLARDAARGTFRQDLYYRLNIVSLRLPALRDRKMDIPELADHFLRRFGANHRLTPETLDAMMNYDWPGNVRELAELDRAHGGAEYRPLAECRATCLPHCRTTGRPSRRWLRR